MQTRKMSMRVSFPRRSRVKSFVMVQNVLSVIVMILFGVLFGLAMIPSYFLFLDHGVGLDIGGLSMSV